MRFAMNKCYTKVLCYAIINKDYGNKTHKRVLKTEKGDAAMRYQLENESVLLSVDSKGAELKSLIGKENGQEYLWCGDEKYWNRTSPVLFPIVGRLIDDRYTYEGKTYEMHQHGFARDREFTLIHQSDCELVMRLQSDDASKAVYPFDFALEIGYRLSEKSVTVSWKVINTGEKEMYFSIGGHPGFVCPLNQEEKQENYSVRIGAGEDSVASTLLTGGYVSDEMEEYALGEGGILPLADGLFDKDALILEDHQAQEAGLVTPDGREYITLKFDAPLFGIWSPPKKHAPFVCIEPWHGRSDRVGFDGSLCDREWGNHLDTGEVFEASYRILIS